MSTDSSQPDSGRHYGNVDSVSYEGLTAKVKHPTKVCCRRKPYRRPVRTEKKESDIEDIVIVRHVAISSTFLTNVDQYPCLQLHLH